MLSGALAVAGMMLGCAMLLNVWRLVLGPAATDRILALDTLSVNAAGIVILYCIESGSTLYFEAALLIALLGFVGTVALAKYLLRGDIIE
ncbi:MAG: K+/H+ antiporter subunit F [Betaproteobacteria bacterium]